MHPHAGARAHSRARAAWVFIVLCAVCSLARAETTTWYTVEVLVFEQVDAVGPEGEVWPLEVPIPSPAGAVALRATVAGPGAPVAFQRLDPREHGLDEAARRLRRSTAYRTLLHVAWRQPGLARDEAPPVLLDSAAPGDGDRPPSGIAPAARPDRPRVSGTIRVYRSRYLHLEADLVYHRPAGTFAPAATAVPTRFRLRERRRMRSRELHFLDHPLFGALVRIEPFEVIVPPAPAPASPPPAPGAPAPAEPGAARTIPLPSRN